MLVGNTESIEELRKQRAEIDKLIKAKVDANKYGRVRLKANEYFCRRKLREDDTTYDVAIKYRDCLRADNDKWRNVISVKNKLDAYDYIVDLIRDLSALAHDLELEAKEE